jgi:hypothetical protein
MHCLHKKMLFNNQETVRYLTGHMNQHDDGSGYLPAMQNSKTTQDSLIIGKP